MHRITDRGDVRVQFNHETRWTFHPGALTKVPRARLSLSHSLLQPLHVLRWPWEWSGRGMAWCPHESPDLKEGESLVG